MRAADGVAIIAIAWRVSGASTGQLSSTRRLGRLAEFPGRCRRNHTIIVEASGVRGRLMLGEARLSL